MKVRYWEAQRLGVKPKRSWQEAAVRWVKETSDKRSHGKDVAKLRWLDRYLGRLMLHQVTRDEIEKIAERKAGESSRSNANRYLALIRSILRRARDDWEWLDHIPKVWLYREPKRRICFLTQEQARRLLAELPPHLRVMARFSLATTGLRQRNVSYLQWDQVDLSRGVAWIHPDQAKAGKAIGVPLNQDALAVLNERRGEHKVYVFTFQGKARGPVFDACMEAGTCTRGNSSGIPVARSAAHVGVMARATRNSAAGTDGIGRLVEL